MRKLAEIPYRMSKNMRAAVRSHCLECNGETRARPDNDCVSVSCFLYPFRPWDGPGKKKTREISDKQREILSERAKKTFSARGGR